MHADAPLTIAVVVRCFDSIEKPCACMPLANTTIMEFIDFSFWLEICQLHAENILHI